MSAVPRLPSDFGYAGLRMTADDYLALGETPERYELIDGVVVMSPSPNFRHQKIVLLLIRQLDAFAQRSGGELIPDIDIRLSPGLVYRPDLVYYGPGRLTGIPARLDTPPDLVIEVLSPGSKPLDLVTKKSDYERFGVGEYWVVDPATGDVRCWSRRGDAFVESRAAGDRLTSGVVSGLVLDLAPLRGVAGRDAGS